MLFLLCSCASRRPSIPPGVVPEAKGVSEEDERFGHDVFVQLTERYPLDQDDANRDRVDRVIENLIDDPRLSNDVWHVYVLKGDDFQNAAAVRGNFIFVWTGMLNAVQNDDELATVLAHELGHLLAGDTARDPLEETGRILSSVGGRITRDVMISSSGSGAVLAGLAGMATQAALQALLINPQQQRQELEADQIGIFLMAENGYRPEAALDFWGRQSSNDSSITRALSFLSTHPSSEERLEQLEKLIFGGLEKAPEGTNANSSTLPDAAEFDYSSESSFDEQEKNSVSKSKSITLENWIVVDDRAVVFQSSNINSAAVAELSASTEVKVSEKSQFWLKIIDPHEGWVRAEHLSPTW